MSIIKQNIGIEVDSKKLKVSFRCLMYDDLHIKTIGSRTFDNTKAGFEGLRQWANKKKRNDQTLHMTMEATGIYYENLAYYLHDCDEFSIHVLLPNISKGYRKSLNLKSKTDDIDSGMLAQLGLERRLKTWTPMSKQMRSLKKVNRERLRLIKEKTMIINQLHAEQHSHDASIRTIKRYEKRIDFIEKQIAQIEKQLKQIICKDPNLKQRIDNVCTAKGLSFITVCGVVAETDGFALFKNRNQLVSYAGYDVIKNESGTSVKGKTKISKKGNSFIRQMMYFAAMTAITHDPHHKSYAQRIIDKTNIYLKANVAIQRKLLLLIYALFKKNKPFDPEYHLRLREKLMPNKEAISIV